MLRDSVKLFNSIQSSKRITVRFIIKKVHSNNRMSLVEAETTSPPITSLKKSSLSIGGTTTLFTGKNSVLSEYEKCIEDLNLLQSNRRILSNDASYMFELFKKQLTLSGLVVKDLDKLKIVHVTGTKGKGSTCAFVESILRASGLKTGLYSSPHLIEVNERIKINGEPISNTKFNQYFRPIYNRLQLKTKNNDLPMPGYFAFLTILAFEIFLKEEVDCLVLEVGIGGQYDSTNLIENPVVCGISTLDYDHTNILGDKIEQIAWTKSGIVKNGVPLFTVEQPDVPQAEQVIRKRCSETASSMHICSALDRNSIKLGIQGDAQYMNAALACQLSRYFLSKNSSIFPQFTPSSEQIQTNLSQLPSFFSEALINCSLPGRCQLVKDGSKTYFIDGAHTKKSMENCLKWFVTNSNCNSTRVKRILILNIIGERDKISILRPLVEYGQFDEVIFTSNRLISVKLQDDKGPKVMNSHTLGETIQSASLNFEAWKSLELEKNNALKTKCSIVSDVTYSLKYIDNIMSGKLDYEAHILVTGSLALVGSILKKLDIENKVKHIS